MAKKEKCILCDEEIELILLEKPLGTVVKIKTGDVNEKYLVCRNCQIKYKDNLKKEVQKLFS